MTRNYVPEELKLISQEEIIPEDELYVVEAIIDHKGEPGAREYLVRWKNYTKEDDSWIPSQNFTDPEIVNQYWRRLGVKPSKKEIEKEDEKYSPQKNYKKSKMLETIIESTVDSNNSTSHISNRKRANNIKNTNNTTSHLRRSKRARNN